MTSSSDITCVFIAIFHNFHGCDFGKRIFWGLVLFICMQMHLFTLCGETNKLRFERLQKGLGVFIDGYDFLLMMVHAIFPLFISFLVKKGPMKLNPRSSEGQKTVFLRVTSQYHTFL